MACAMLVPSLVLRPLQRDVATARDSAEADPPLLVAVADAWARAPHTPPLWRSLRAVCGQTAAGVQVRSGSGGPRQCLFRNHRAESRASYLVQRKPATAGNNKGLETSWRIRWKGWHAR